METNTGKQEVVRIIQNLSGKHSPYVIFYDFCKMFSISIANACKYRHDEVWQKREDAYVEVAKKYTEQEMIQFIELKEHLIEAFEEKMVDAFGKAIRALEEQPEWISVSDRLPANANFTEKAYFVQLANDSVMTLNYYDGWNCFVDRDGNYHNDKEIKNVLFWMELPKPKEVDEDDEEETS